MNRTHRSIATTAVTRGTVNASEALLRTCYPRVRMTRPFFVQRHTSSTPIAQERESFFGVFEPFRLATTVQGIWTSGPMTWAEPEAGLVSQRNGPSRLTI